MSRLRPPLINLSEYQYSPTGLIVEATKSSTLWAGVAAFATAGVLSVINSDQESTRGFFEYFLTAQTQIAAISGAIIGLGKTIYDMSRISRLSGYISSLRRAHDDEIEYQNSRSRQDYERAAEISVTYDDTINAFNRVFFSRNKIYEKRKPKHSASSSDGNQGGGRGTRTSGRSIRSTRRTKQR